MRVRMPSRNDFLAKFTKDVVKCSTTSSAELLEPSLGNGCSDPAGPKTQKLTPASAQVMAGANLTSSARGQKYRPF